MNVPPIIHYAQEDLNQRTKPLQFALVIAGCALIGAIVLMVLQTLRDPHRVREFQKQASLGVPIVNAIEQFSKQTGRLPDSLSALVPQFLSAIPETPNPELRKFYGWEYQLVTNATIISYELSYNMGRGGIEYKAPLWYGNDEGTVTVLQLQK